MKKIVLIFSLMMVVAACGDGGKDNGSNKEEERPRFEKLNVTGTSWECVKDLQTNLAWEVKSREPGLRFQGNSYAWFNSDLNTNGGYSGTYREAGDCTESDCNTEAYLQAVNKNKLCGFSNWRVPTLEEMVSLLVPTYEDMPANEPGYGIIDRDFFPNHQYFTGSTYDWSATTDPDDIQSAYSFLFDGGYKDSDPKDYNHTVRLVRSY